MQAFKYNDITIHYRVSGNGNPVVFLHGFLENHSMWKTAAAHFESKGCQTILIDLPCHGKSRFEGDICTMSTMASLVHELLQHLNINHPFVFGHSMGGYVGLELLKLRTINLTLVHANFWADSKNKKEDRNRVIEIVRTNKMRLIQEAIPNLFATQNRTDCNMIIESLISEAAKIPSKEICAATAGMRDRNNNTALLNKYRINIIHGTQDPIISNALLKENLNNIDNAPLMHSIKNCGHMSIWETPLTLINFLNVIVFR